MTQNDDDDDDNNNNNNSNIPLLKNYVLTLYGVIHNSLTRYKKSVHLKDAKDDHMRHTVTGTSYLDMMQEWLMPQLDDDSDDFIYQ
jgi:hypothetical protein